MLLIDSAKDENAIDIGCTVFWKPITDLQWALAGGHKAFLSRKALSEITKARLTA